MRVVKYRRKNYLVLYSLGEHKDYHHGYMVPSTGYLKWFDLQLLGEGFVLRFPRKNSPKTIAPMPSYPKLLSTFRQYGNWLLRLGIESVGALNEAIEAGNIKEVILVSEALHEMQIMDIAQYVAERSEDSRIILVAGRPLLVKQRFRGDCRCSYWPMGFHLFPLKWIITLLIGRRHQRS